ncbi:uncharacterized protein METZ01_LOCUS358013, partial [marine metagenome]
MLNQAHLSLAIVAALSFSSMVLTGC